MALEGRHEVQRLGFEEPDDAVVTGADQQLAVACEEQSVGAVAAQVLGRQLTPLCDVPDMQRMQFVRGSKVPSVRRERRGKDTRRTMAAGPGHRQWSGRAVSQVPQVDSGP